MIKSFRGQLEEGEEETIRLGTNKGMVGYKIKKFRVMPTSFVNAELVVRLWLESPPVPGAAINFDDSSMLGVAMYSSAAASESNPDDEIIIFDNVTFNQDIYITNLGIGNAQTMNYYLELEQIKLNENEATVATLKDMRGSN